ncbi:MAG: arginine--tRNA ligase [Lachnospiraceae bacterium]|nr:arginine--tRNA ligase [Lachnospiraceae bacterium]
MEQFLNLISKEMESAFEAAGYDSALGRVTVSNRPDLCEYQCNGAMAGAKRYHKAPFMIADDVAKALAAKNEGTGSDVFSKVEVVKPGFLNLDVDESFLRSYLQEMSVDERLGMPVPEKAEKIIIDYGGPNVAKPLHVGHLRSAVIGEAVKRIARFHGEDVIGDIHLGDWGLQMGLVITELKKRMPDLPYFDPDYTGEYPEEAPFTVSELEEIYPFASAKSKQDPDYYAEAMDNTRRLQEGERGLYALWQKIVGVSVADMKRNYENLNVSFDLWNGEASVHPVIPGMVEDMKKGGYAYESQGALVIDVAEETDAKEIPPCIVLKSDGASLYTTTDLATIKERVEKYNPDKIIYITDKRQELHFTQVFRAAVKSGLAGPDTKLIHIGFGTMNGKDGKPFKTREGGVMRLETLIADIDAEMLSKISTNPEIPAGEAEQTSRQVALAALKYGDLSNQASKDYIFDIEKFTSFEGDTGPYILYTIVRMRSILQRYAAEPDAKDPASLRTGVPASAVEKKLMMDIAGFNAMMEGAYTDCAPHRICAYIYQLSNDFNSFYHATRILTEQDQAQKESWIALLHLTERVLSCCINVLGFSAPERM